MATAANYDTTLSGELESQTLTDTTPSQYKYDDSSWEEEGMQDVKGLAEKTWPQGVEVYSKQKGVWPGEGNHILATYDEDSIVVYQAFCPAIADAAVREQR